MKWWDRRELLPTLERLAVVAAGALLVWAAWCWIDRALLPPSAGRDSSADEATQRSAVLEETLRRVNDRNILLPPRPSGFQLQLAGVAGNEAIFAGGQAAGVGGNVGGATIVALGPDWVEIEFEGNTQKLHVFGQGGGGGPTGESRPGMDRPERRDPERMREWMERRRARGQ